MPTRNPIAFLSYVRDDDAHDFGGVTKFRERLEGEVKIQSGQRFEIFQDRNDIRWGQFWQERILELLADVTFLIPIVTPSFLASYACRSEVEAFLRMEQTLGSNKLILPVYYVSCDAIDNGDDNKDVLVAAIKKRNWTDWRSFRFTSFDDPAMRVALADLAKSIKSAMQELVGIAEAAAHAKPQTDATGPDDAATIGHRGAEDHLERADAVVLTRGVQAELVEALAIQAVSLPRPTETDHSNVEPPKNEFYWVYTSEFDEVIAATELAGDPSEAILLQTELAVEIASLKRRHLTFFQSIRTVTNQQDTAVTLLLDNSGSLRNYKILRGRPLSVSGLRFPVSNMRYLATQRDLGRVVKAAQNG